MPAFKPIGHEQRLSIVDHLDELRSRIIMCLLAFGVAFGVCYWQNDEVLDIVNRPVKDALSLKVDGATNDPDKQSAAFERRLAELLEANAALLVTVQAQADDPEVRRQAAEVRRRTQAAIDAAPTVQTRRPTTFALTEPFLTTIKVASYAAILLVLPFLLYQLYAFVLPAFTPRERRAVLPLLLLVPLLFTGGVLFGYYVALPRAADFLLNFNADEFDIQLRAQDYYSFAIVFLAALGAMFQMPVGVTALTRLRIVTVAQLRRSRGYAILVMAVAAAVVTPTPDPVTMLVTMAPLVVLYELSILLARFLERAAPDEDEAALPLDEDLDPLL